MERVVSPERGLGRTLVQRLLRFRMPTPDYAEHFRRWFGAQLVFLAFITVLIGASALPGHALVSLTLFGPLVLMVAGAGLWWTLYQRGPRPVADFQRGAYRGSFVLALYVGVAGAVLLDRAGLSLLPHILIWQYGAGLALASLTGFSTFQFVTRLVLSLLPTTTLLFWTADPVYGGLGMLVLSVAFVPALIKLLNTETFQRLAAGIRQADQKRALAETRVSDYLAATSDWFWESDATHRLLLVSENFTAIADPGQTNGPGGLFGPHADPAQTATIYRAMRMREVFDNLELSFQGQDDTAGLADIAPRHWYSVSGRPLFDRHGAFTGYSGWAIDITGPVRAREKLQRYRAAVEERVTARTAEISTRIDQLEEAVVSARRQSARKSDLIRQSHRVMAGHITQLEAKAASGNAAIGSLQRKMARLNDHLLYLSRLEEPADERESEVVSFDDLVQSVFGELSGLSEARKVRLEAALCGWQIFVPPVDLRKALQEVLLCALRSSPEGGRVEIGFAEDRLGLHLTVHDDGPAFSQLLVDALEDGLDPHADPLSRLPSGPIGDNDTALGLSIAQALIAPLKGRLTLHQPTNGIEAFPQTGRDPARRAIFVTLPRVRRLNGQSDTALGA